MDAPRKILFFRTDRLGDFLLNLPTIHEVKKNYPKAHISCVIHPDNLDIASHQPDIDQCIPFLPKKSLWYWIKFFLHLKKQKFDIAIISNPHKFFHLFTFLISIPVRVGYRRKWGFFLTHSIPDRKHESLKHEVEYNLDLVSKVKSNIRYEIFISEKARQSLTDIFIKRRINAQKPLIVINPYTTAAHKQWPIVNFIFLINKLSSSSHQTILIGGEKESLNIKEEMTPFLKEKVFDLSGLLTLSECAALLQRTSLFMSNDSGPMHIASAFKTPMIVLFGNRYGSNPTRWGPWNKENVTIIENENIQDINVEEVWEHVQKNLTM